MIRQESAPPAPPWWFLSLVFLGAAYVATVTLRLLAYLAFSLHRQPKDLRSRYGAWAVITGPTSGMGRAMALELARRGLNLVLVGRDPANLEEISNTVRSLHGVETKTVVFDLSLVATPHGDEPLRQLRETVEGLDVGVLMNNAGVGEPAMAYLHEADVEAWVRMMRVNLWAVTEVTAAVLPGMVERGRGAVVNIGSASSQAIPSFPLCTIYSATKRCRYVAHFSRSLHLEYASAVLRGDEDGGEPGGGEAPLAVHGHPGRLRARAAVGWIGRGGPLCTPNVRHRLLWCAAAAAPDSVLDWFLLRSHLEQRTTLSQQIRASGAPAPS
ncbi:hypothetical protein DAI22_06g125400 [Oryza sativa Japonica Group]|nr:hypothetical protein DAI22_06g125400 [Oryza sativa Japonica Group]